MDYFCVVAEAAELADGYDNMKIQKPGERMINIVEQKLFDDVVICEKKYTTWCSFAASFVDAQQHLLGYILQNEQMFVNLSW